MKVFAIATPAAGTTLDTVRPYLPAEVPATLQHYLDGKVEQFWFQDNPGGPIFLMNVDSVDEAKSVVGSLPLTDAGLMTYRFIPVGPLSPLGLLLAGK